MARRPPGQDQTEWQTKVTRAVVTLQCHLRGWKNRRRRAAAGANANANNTDEAMDVPSLHSPESSRRPGVRGVRRSAVVARAAPVAVAAAQAEHLRDADGFFFWLLPNRPGALSISHAVHRMASAASATGARRRRRRGTSI